jgi:hypothetical protein
MPVPGVLSIIHFHPLLQSSIILMEAAIAHFTFLALHANIKKIKISQ